MCEAEQRYNVFCRRRYRKILNPALWIVYKRLSKPDNGGSKICMTAGVSVGNEGDDGLKSVLNCVRGGIR
jgi:hypothetical protein